MLVYVSPSDEMTDDPSEVARYPFRFLALDQLSIGRLEWAFYNRANP
jgi:hypothetical protein